MYVQKAEAEKPSHGIHASVVEDEPQGDPGHNARVARTALQRAPHHHADIKLTNESRARLRRQVWPSFLWLMASWWVQVNVLSAVRSL